MMPLFSKFAQLIILDIAWDTKKSFTLTVWLPYSLAQNSSDYLWTFTWNTWDEILNSIEDLILKEE